MWRRLRHIGLALGALPGLLGDAHQRRAFAEMRRFCAALPAALDAPVPSALQALTPQASTASRLDERSIRTLADLAALLVRRSPLGLCLRRSLTRYHFLRRAGIPVVLQFGARFAQGQPDRNINGHAWLTLNNAVYYEDDENWRGFTAMFAYPS